MQTKDDEVIGLHNWIQIYHQEKVRKIDYRGYIKPKRKPRGTASLPSSCQQLVTLQFSWDHALKPCSSSFIGTSPEFEMALFTLCFFLGESENVVQVGPYK
jgi:poly(U)-specific endoribonuclease